MGTKPKDRIVLSDAELLDYSAKHLHYEVWMLFCARGLMLNRQQAFHGLSDIAKEDCRVELNAAVESFALHVRSLILFLDPDRLQPDDVTAKDFLDAPADWSPPPRERFATARQQANKQVAHLTKLRIDGYHPDKEWNPELADQLTAALQDFAQKASPKKLAVRFRELLDSVT